MRIYVAGPMQGYPDFNFPAFHYVAAFYRSNGHEVFSPADKDIEKHGAEALKSATGKLDDIKNSGFSLREALAADTEYICLHADTIVMLPGWENSKGAQAEWALARALGHKFIYATQALLEMGRVIYERQPKPE